MGAVLDLGLTILVAAEVLSASGVRAHGGISVVHQAVILGAFEFRAEFV